MEGLFTIIFQLIVFVSVTRTCLSQSLECRFWLARGLWGVYQTFVWYVLSHFVSSIYKQKWIILHVYFCIFEKKVFPRGKKWLPPLGKKWTKISMTIFFSLVGFLVIWVMVFWGGGRSLLFSISHKLSPWDPRLGSFVP